MLKCRRSELQQLAGHVGTYNEHLSADHQTDVTRHATDEVNKSWAIAGKPAHDEYLWPAETSKRGKLVKI